jgi:hypothetical protein
VAELCPVRQPRPAAPSPLSDHRCFARCQRSSRSASSCSRPTSGVSCRPCRASNRLSARLGPATRHTLTGAGKPFTICSSGASNVKASPAKARVRSETTISPERATPWSRNARLGVSPITASASEPSDPIRSPTMTTPVATPTRASRRPACAPNICLPSRSTSLNKANPA